MFFRRGRNNSHASAKRTSVILRRQVPIRFDEAPRSWLGGLPMMPEGAKWPRDAEGAPLHFIAQIACADLPPDLWNGLGPRKGWLLLFAEVLKLEDEAEGDTVQVLHINRLGPEHEPPEDVPTVRHAMSDYIDYAKPNLRSGVPKLWRRWPVDLVAREYTLSNDAAVNDGPPTVPAEELYGAPVSDKGVVPGGMGLDRPLTWRGALYVVEGLVRDLEPEDFERNFIGEGGLIEPPEPDQDAFNKEFERRAAERQEFQDREVGWGPRVSAARDALTAEIAAERKAGWIARAFAALEEQKAKFEARRDDDQRKFDDGQGALDQAELNTLKESVQYRISTLRKLEQHRDHLNQINEAYPGPDGEARLNAEIKRLGEAHLKWAAKQNSSLKNLMNHILAQDLDAPLSNADWRMIETAFAGATSGFWQKTYDTRVLEKSERELHTRKHLEMAVREDVLDAYTCNDESNLPLSREKLDEIEGQLRFIDYGLHHRVGDLPNPVQGENDPDMLLLFQIASDAPMGWMWGDGGALYVTISPEDLRRNRFRSIHAWIEGH